jgi:hypothetical protein
LLADIRSFMDGDRKRDGIDTIAKFYRHAAIIRNFSGLRILIHLIRIRIQQFRLNTNPDPIRIQGF